MFAGAAREAVFANPEVIRRVNADFVPVALKAGLVNRPPDNAEGRLYREIGRSKPAPQGICVVNSAGKVLDWALMFDDDPSVLAFLDHCLKRFAQFPDAKTLFPAERFMKFPSQKLADVADNGEAPPIVEGHARGEHCPGTPHVHPGTVVARVFGRALDKDGRPVADTLRQEHYVEDRFDVPVAMQAALAKALRSAGGDRFRLADDLARLLVSHAFLGQLDVNPVSAMAGKGSLKQCEFWAQRVTGADDDLVRVCIAGRSEAAGGSNDGPGGDQEVDGRIWEHAVKLTWEGIVEMKQNRMARLLVVARGSERLKWGNRELKGQAGDVTRLPAGHPIDLRAGVRYGMIGVPAPEEQTSGIIVPDEAQKHMLATLGGLFIIGRARVPEELQLSDRQKEKLLENLPAFVQETVPVFESLQGLKAEEREKALEPHRQKAQEKLAAFLKDTLNAAQLKRLQQLELQQHGLLTLGRPEIARKLHITAAQHKQFMGAVQGLQKKLEPLMRAAHSGADPQVIGPRIMKARQDCEARIEAMLSDTQKAQWKELIGRPFAMAD